MSRNKFSALTTVWRTHWPLIVVLVICAIALQAWLKPGLIAGDDFQPIPEALLKTYVPWPHLWDNLENFGYSRIYWGPSFPLFLLCGLFSLIGLHWNAIERIVFLYPFLFGAPICMYIFTYRALRYPLGSAAAALLFSLNPWTVGLIERGHLPALDAAVFMPLIFHFLRSGIFLRSWPGVTLLAVTVCIQSFYEVRYTYITVAAMLFFLFVWWFRSGFKVQWSADSLRWLVVPVTLLLVNLHWLANTVLFPLGQEFSAHTGLQAFVTASSGFEVAKSASLFFPYYHYVVGTNGFANDPLEAPFTLIPLFALASAFLLLRRLWAAALGFLALIAVVLASGANGVFGTLNQYLFLHVPGLSLFRDPGKFFALIAFGYAALIAGGLTRWAAFCRRQLGPLRGRRADLITAALFGVLYVIVMRDAFNPNRLSNFATLQIPAEDKALQHFFDADASYFRILVFPTQLTFLDPTEQHPLVWASGVSDDDPPLGFSFLLPDASHFESWYTTSLAPGIIRALNIRYIVVMNDPLHEEYRSFNYGIQRAQLVDTLNGLSWLRQRARFGDAVVFEVLQSRVIRGYIAPVPTLFVGGGASWPALVGTPYWNDRPAVVEANQLPNAEDPWRWKNAVIGTLLYSDTAEAHSTITQLLSRERSWLQYVNTLPDAAYAFTAAAMTNDSNSWSNGLFAYTFTLPRARFFSPYIASSPVTEALSSFKPEAVRSYSVPSDTFIFCPPPHVEFPQSTTPVDPTAPEQGYWLSVAGTTLAFTIVNGCALPLQGSVQIPRIMSESALVQPLQIDAADHNYSMRALLDRWWSGGLPSSANLSNLTVPVGQLPVLLRAPGTPTDHPLTLRLFAPNDFGALSLVGKASLNEFAVSIVRREVGVGISGVATNSARLARITLLQPRALRLDTKPIFEIDYFAPSNGAMSVLVELVNRKTGNQVECWLPLDTQAQHARLDVFQGVQDLFDSAWSMELFVHRRDPSWLVKQRLSGPLAASDFTVSSIGLGIVATPPFGQDHIPVFADVRTAALSFLAEGIKPPAHHDTNHLFNLTASRERRVKNVALRALTVNAHSTAVTVEIDQRPPVPVYGAIEPGDYVALRSNDGVAINGNVRKITRTSIEIQAGGNTVEVMRTSISTILQHYHNLTKRLDWTVPIPASPVGLGATLNFYAKLPNDFNVALDLLLRNPAHRLTRLPASLSADQQQSTFLPDQWIQGYANLDERPIGTPLVLISGYQITQDWAHFVIPLSQLVSVLGGLSGGWSLVGLEFQFVNNGSLSEALGAFRSFGLSDLILTGQIASRIDPSRESKTGVLIDGTELQSTVTDTSEGGALVTRARNVELSNGQHGIVSFTTSRAVPQNALLVPLSVHRDRTAVLRNFSTRSADDLVAVLDSNGGLLVAPMGYDTGWALAVLPAESAIPREPLLLRWLHARRWLLPSTAHIPVNGSMNGWFVPKGHYTVEMLYLPDAVSQCLALLAILLVASVVLFFALQRGRSPAK